jgi:hypothetical protein
MVECQLSMKFMSRLNYVLLKDDPGKIGVAILGFE